MWDERINEKQKAIIMQMASSASPTQKARELQATVTAIIQQLARWRIPERDIVDCLKELRLPYASKKNSQRCPENTCKKAEKSALCAENQASSSKLASC